MGKLVGECSLLLRLRGGDLLAHGGQVLAILQSLGKRSLRIQVVQRGVGLGVGEPVGLIQRQTDGARQRKLVLGQLVGGGDQALLLVLVIHLRAQHIQPRADAGVVRGRGLVQRDLAGGKLGVDRGDARRVGNAQQIRVAHSQHHQVARVLCGQLGGGEVVFRGDVVLQRRVR